MEEEVVLCAASAYEQKFYLNPQFESLPGQDSKIQTALFLFLLSLIHLLSG